MGPGARIHLGGFAADVLELAADDDALSAFFASFSTSRTERPRETACRASSDGLLVVINARA